MERVVECWEVRRDKMSIFKGKEIRLLKANVEHNQERLMRLECDHTEVCYYDYGTMHK